VSATVTDDAHESAFVLSSPAVKVTGVVPNGKNPGASLETAGVASQVSVALTPPKNGASCGSAALMPPIPVHSTVAGAGHVMAGGIVSATITRAWHEAEFSASSVAVKFTGVVPRANRAGASLAGRGARSRPGRAGGVCY
jgi:hypothetical protein